MIEPLLLMNPAVAVRQEKGFKEDSSFSSRPDYHGSRDVGRLSCHDNSESRKAVVLPRDGTCRLEVQSCVRRIK